MYKSSVLNEYAQRMGYIKTAEEKKESLEDLKNLYNVKPNGKDDEISLIEKAHPDTIIAGRAYDAFNSVIENDLQRQDIISWIVQKVPDGHLTHQRYVKYKSDLMSSLVQVAFKMDNENNEDLMKLADACVVQLDKRAIAPLAILGYAGIASGLAYLGWAAHGGVTVQNVYANAKLLLDQLQDVPDRPYAGVLTQTAEKLMRDAVEFGNIRTQIISGSLTSIEQVVDKVSDEAYQKNAARLGQIEKIWDVFLQIYPRYVEAVKASIASGNNDESADWWQKLKDLGKSVIPSLDEDKQVLDYLEGLRGAVIEAKKQANGLKMLGMQKANQMKPQLEESLDKKKESLDIPSLEDMVEGFSENVPKL